MSEHKRDGESTNLSPGLRLWANIQRAWDLDHAPVNRNPTPNMIESWLRDSLVNKQEPYRLRRLAEHHASGEKNLDPTRDPVSQWLERISFFGPRSAAEAKFIGKILWFLAVGEDVGKKLQLKPSPAHRPSSSVWDHVVYYVLCSQQAGISRKAALQAVTKIFAEEGRILDQDSIEVQFQRRLKQVRRRHESGKRGKAD